MIAAIACVDSNYGIGYKNNLLLKIPEDMKRFKQLTNNSIVIMGKKTWDSLPSKPLPNRFNVVVTHNADKLAMHNMNGTMFVSMERAKEIIEKKDYPSGYSNADMFIIGGESIYKELLPYCDDIYLTELCHSFKNVDAYFPAFGSSDWERKERSEFFEYADILYRFFHFVRRKTTGDDSMKNKDTNKTTKVALPDTACCDVLVVGQNNEQFDIVENPQHYTDGKIEVIDFIEDKKLGFCLGNVVKYVARAGKKKDAKLSDEEKELEDLKKARWYLNRRIFEVESKMCLA